MNAKAKHRSDTWRSEEVRPIAVPLPGFRYQHSPDEAKGAQDLGFVGRDELIEELHSVLRNTRSSRGSYLLAGFRGTGKTSVMNKALEVYNGHSDHLEWLPAKPGSARIGAFAFAWFRYRGRRLCGQGARRGNFWPSRQIARVFRWLRRHLPIARHLLFNPLIHVRVNLAADQSLEPRNVLLNTGHLLHSKLQRVERHPLRSLRRWIGFLGVWCVFCILVLGVLASLQWVDEKAFGAQSQARSQSGNNFVAAVATLFLGADKVDQTSAQLPSTSWQRLGALILFVGIPFLFARHAWRHWLPNCRRIMVRLERLLNFARLTHETDLGFQPGAGLRLNRRVTTPPLEAAQIEAELLDILEDCRKVWWVFGRPDVVFVFDELDKIAAVRGESVERRVSPREASTFAEDSPTWTTREVYRRKQRVDGLLATIKNFITEGKARFFFIAGREMLDAYQAERGSTSSLYESLFNRVFEVPSLLTDASVKPKGRVVRLTEAFVCRRLLPPEAAAYLWTQFEDDLGEHGSDYRKGKWIDRVTIEYKPFRLRTVFHWLCIRGVDIDEARRIVFLLRHFVHFLALHSWGNCKRLNSLFEHFIKPDGTADPATEQDRRKLQVDSPPGLVLQFGRMDQQRILLASNLFIPVHHHLRRQHTTGSDKLAVSLLAALQYLLKFHRFPFARSNLDRMDEVLNIHRSPELNSAIDTLLNLVLRPQVRLIRNGLSRYRFIHGLEQELRYISRVSDIESAAFNFSLDSSAGVKQHYQELLRHARGQYRSVSGAGTVGSAEIADISIALGDLLTQEESFDQAAVHFQEALDVLSPLLRVDEKSGSRVEPVNAKILLQFVEAQLKLGDVNERRQRYDRAAAAYLNAQLVVRTVLGDDQTGVGYPRQPPSAPAWRLLDHHVVAALARGDSKWDILKQPLWALWFLNLKRSPLSALAELPPAAAPFYGDTASSRSARDENVDELRDQDPVYLFRVGQVAFFFGQYDLANTQFHAAARCADARLAVGIEQVLDTERAAYVSGYACLDLAESLLVGFVRSRYAEVVSGLRRRGRHGRKTSGASLDVLLRDYAIQVLRVIGSLGRDPQKYELIASISEADTLSYEEIRRLIAAAGGQNSRGSLRLRPIFGMMLVAAKRFERRGLFYHAHVANLKVLSLWNVLNEAVPTEWLTEVIPDGSPLATAEWHAAVAEAKAAVNSADQLLQHIADSASRCVRHGTGNAFGDAWYKVWYSDFPGWPTGDKGGLLAVRSLDPGPGERVDRIFKPKRKADRETGEVVLFDAEVEQATPVWHFSMLHQKLVSASIWWQVLRHRRMPSGPGECGPDAHTGLRLPESQVMVPSSVRSLLFAHWLRGRTLTWCVLREVRKAKALAKTDRTHCAKREESVYAGASRAAHNLYRAHYYIRQTCGNDQDIMFPSPALIFYALWRLIHTLVDLEYTWAESKGMQDETYHRAIRRVRECLALRSDRATPGNYFDYVYVLDRVLSYLRDVEQLQDLSSRARADVIKGKFFLADDYEDPRFHLDWTMIQMLAPLAALLREQILEANKRLRH